MASDNRKIAENILAAIGGKDNITALTHCMTRLRFTLKDRASVNDDAVKGTGGVLGTNDAADQYQVVIGTNVEKVYTELCTLAEINETAGEAEESKPVKNSPNAMGFVSDTLTGLISIFLCVAIFRTIQVILGPDMLNLIPADGKLYVFFDFIYDSFFHFLPVIVGCLAAKAIGMDMGLGAFAGCLLVAPEFLNAAQAGEAFSVFCIPAPALNYSQTILPILFIIPAVNAVNKLIKKVIPDILSSMFAGFLTIVICLPLIYCVLGPAGWYLGSWIIKGIVWLTEKGGFVAVAVVAAVWELLVSTGMHGLPAMLALLANGSESLFLTASFVATWSAFGTALGAYLRFKEGANKAMALDAFRSGIIGGVGEPTLFGITMKYKRCLVITILASMAGGIYAGLKHVAVYVLTGSNLFTLLGFAAGGKENFLNGILACALTFVLTAVLTYLFGFRKDEI